MIFRISGILGLLFMLAAGGYYYKIHYQEVRSFSKTSYKGLQSLKLTFEVKLRNAQNRILPDNDQDAIFKRRTDVVLIKEFIKKIEKEIFMRQISLVLGLLSALFMMPYLLWKFFRIIRLIRFGKDARVKGVYHRGHVKSEPPRILYINQDELHQKVVNGFSDKKEAENFLRTDGFLLCPHCSTLVKTDDIGSVQEMILMEEPPLGASKDYRNQLGSTWEAKPRDQYRCQKCGRNLIRSMRGS